MCGGEELARFGVPADRVGRLVSCTTSCVRFALLWRWRPSIRQWTAPVFSTTCQKSRVLFVSCETTLTKRRGIAHAYICRCRWNECASGPASCPRCFPKSRPRLPALACPPPPGVHPPHARKLTYAHSDYTVCLCGGIESNQELVSPCFSVPHASKVV